jgi:hypothetical protein
MKKLIALSSWFWMLCSGFLRGKATKQTTDTTNVPMEQPLIPMLLIQLLYSSKNIIISKTGQRSYQKLKQGTSM